MKQNLPARQIGAAVAEVWDVGKLVEGSKEFSDNPVRSLHAVLLHEVQPDGVDIEDGIFGKPKLLQRISLGSPGALL